MKITIHAVVSIESIDYYRYLQASHLNLAARPDDVTFYAYCLGDESYPLLSQDAKTKKAFLLPRVRSSLGHAIALEESLRNFVPGQYNLIADTDTVMLRQDWDKIFLLSLETYDLIGATVYENIGGFSSGTTLNQTYKGMPCLIWTIFRPDLNVDGLKDLHPDLEHPLPIDSEELSKTFHLPVGYSLVRDVAWQVPVYLHKNEIKYETIFPVKPSSNDSLVLKGTSDYHDEFHYQGKPFLVHQRGSRKHRFRVDPLSKNFYNACERYLGNPPWSFGPPLRLSNFLNQRAYGYLSRKLAQLQKS